MTRRLRPVLDRLRADRELREEFLRFAGDRGGHVSLLVQRLNKAWWQSRSPQFVHFFVLTLAEFGFTRGIIDVAPASAPVAKRPSRRRR